MIDFFVEYSWLMSDIKKRNIMKTHSCKTKCTTFYHCLHIFTMNTQQQYISITCQKRFSKLIILFFMVEWRISSFLDSLELRVNTENDVTNVKIIIFFRWRGEQNGKHNFYEEDKWCVALLSHDDHNVQKSIKKKSNSRALGRHCLVKIHRNIICLSAFTTEIRYLRGGNGCVTIVRETCSFLINNLNFSNFLLF
jgi:hypothetical protein